ncbi:MAG: DNA replication/repair protein RecF [Sphingomonas bacterium]|nr:DNA replication/repair protein RecF [Sphingomonas bacterium]
MIARLTLTDFRNHPAALIAPGAGFVLLSGDNGAGKTNVLEAVSLLTPGRGLRGASLGEMARSEGPGGFGVAATLLPPLPPAGGERGEGPSSPIATSDMPSPGPSREREGGISLGTGTLATAPERRQVRINGAAASVNSLSEWLSVLWLTPAMDRLFADSAGNRRRFLDRLTLALEPGHATHAARYEAAMRARNKLLAEPEHADPSWLAALEAGMAEHGAALGEARALAVAALGEAMTEQRSDDFPRAALALEGWDGGDLASQLKATRGRDAAAGRATVGPHRQDLSVSHVAKAQPAARSSTGEQKALLLGIVLAHAELVASRRGAPPILLLDEVAAHLDPRRRAALFARLEGRGQVWMTATEPDLFSEIGASASRFHVAGGTISPA